MMVIYYTNQFGNNKGESHDYLAAAIREHLGCTASEAREAVGRMVKGEFGKPSIEGVPEFSISHSQNMWAVLFDSSDCGLDIQHHQTIDYMKIAKRWYHEDEVRYLDGLAGEELVVGFYKIWTRREALVKANGLSIFNAGLPCTLPDSVQFNGQLWKFQDFTITGADNMSVAFCVKDVDEMNIIWLSQVRPALAR